MIDDKRISEFDDMFDYSKYLLNIDERTRVRRLAFKPIWPTSPRDFVIGTTWTELKNGSILIVSRSVPNVMGEESGYVRGNVQISGYLIQPQHTNNTEVHTSQNHDNSTNTNGAAAAVLPPKSPIQKCKITLCTHTELGGSLPSSIVNMLATGAPVKILDSIRNIVVKKK